MSKNTTNRLAFNVAFCGIISALGVIVMYLSLIPSLAYAVPAVAGLLIWTISEQINIKWACLSFITVSVLSFMLVPEIEANLFLVMFFGYYPTLRALLDKIKIKPVGYILRLVIFNVAVVGAYNIMVAITSSEEMLEGLEAFGQYAIFILWGIGNVAFILFDLCLDTIKAGYIKLLKPKLNSKLK